MCTELEDGDENKKLRNVIAIETLRLTLIRIVSKLEKSLIGTELDDG